MSAKSTTFFQEIVIHLGRGNLMQWPAIEKYVWNCKTRGNGFQNLRKWF